MSCKNNQRKDSCSKSFAICSVYQGEIPETSELAEETCVSVEEVIDDLYVITTDIKQQIDVSEITSCITLPTTKTAATLIQTALDAICDLKDTITTQATTITTMQAQIAALQDNECP